MTTEIKDYLRQLLIDAGQTGMGEKMENVLIDDLYARLEERLILAAMLSLPGNKKGEAEVLMNKTSKKIREKKLVEFFKKNIPDYEKVIGEALMDFREVYIDAVKGSG